MNDLTEIGTRARRAARILALVSGEAITKALLAMADSLEASKEGILEANVRDLKAAERSGVKGALLDRLTLNGRRIDSMGEALRAVADQPDGIGEIIDAWDRPNGLRIQKVRVPLGVVAVIYEARPNVTADVAALCLRSKNAALLRGSSHALHSNLAIVKALRSPLADAGLPEDAIQMVDDTSREAALQLMRLESIDLLVPRGGPALIQSVVSNARVPFIIDGDGNCHVYVDRAADPDKATEIAINAKCSRPSVCNAAETLLVHRQLAETWLPVALGRLSEAGVEIRGDDQTRALWPRALPATDEDWATEYLDLILAVRVVEDLQEAVDHINRWGTSNAEAIVTEDEEAARAFTERVDSGSIFVNASTRFSDGGEFGYGAEIGISTQKLHARGPMGPEQLTTFKYVVWGEGQTRSL